MTTTHAALPELQRDIAGRPVAIVARQPGGGDGPFARVVSVSCDGCLDEALLREAFQLTPRQTRTVQLLYGRRTNRKSPKQWV